MKHFCLVNEEKKGKETTQICPVGKESSQAKRKESLRAKDTSPLRGLREPASQRRY